MCMIDVYDFSYRFLLKEADGTVDKAYIDAFLEPPEQVVTSRQKAFELLLYILQDFNRYPGVIRYRDRQAEIAAVLEGNSLVKTAALTPEELLERFRKAFGFSADRMWRRYAAGVIDGAAFLMQFRDDEDFAETFRLFDSNEMTRESLALLLEKQITNLGFASACSWLKELGYAQYLKPDVHLKEICRVLFEPAGTDDVRCFEILVKAAGAAGVTPFTLDRLWWVICSGDFLDGKHRLPAPRKRKQLFLERLEAKEYLQKTPWT